MHWNGRTYQEIMADDVRARLWNWLDTCCCRSKEGRLTKFLPNRSNVSGVFDALKAVANLPAGMDIPSWIGGGDFPMPENLVAFDNGLLDLRQSWPVKNRSCCRIRPVGFRPIACRIALIHWPSARDGLTFLNQVFEGDEERIRCLAQWFGYCLTLDIRQQRFMLADWSAPEWKGNHHDGPGSRLGPGQCCLSEPDDFGDSFWIGPAGGQASGRRS